jgi:hypothetical protein
MRRHGRPARLGSVEKEDPMLLVPRQLQRAGMTGNVPYYGGPFTPAQAYAAAHPSQQRPPRPVPQREAGQLAALQHLRDTGVINEDEYRTLRARVTR